MNDFTDGLLTIRVSQAADGRALRLDWLGRSSATGPGTMLEVYFDDLTREAKRRDAGVELHFERLEHMNSSTIVCLLKLVRSFANQHLKLLVVYDASLKWQQLCFDALRVFEGSDGRLVIRPATEGA